MRFAASLVLLTACGAADRPADGPPAPEGDDTGGGETIPDRAAPWVRESLDSPGSIAFNEVHHHPLDPSLVWIELYNPMALDVDLTGWALADGVTYAFPEGTIAPAGGHLVVAADPEALAEAGHAGALGPFDGQLSEDGERLTLLSNGGRRIDSVRYGDDDPWPVAPDGSGYTLAKADPDAASDRAENWTSSAAPGGTPGRANGLDTDAPPETVTLVAGEATWRYDVSGAYPASSWADPDHDDGGWRRGEAGFYSGVTTEDAPATVWVTADNYYAVYLGRSDGSELRLVAEDPDGDWTTVERVDLEVRPREHLYLAAWEAPWDDGGPQMLIAEVDLPDGGVGTDADGFEWALGPEGGCPGAAPADPPPAGASLADLVADAEATGAWATPAAQADRASDPWGWATSAAFSADARYIWADTFESASITNTSTTYALFRSRDPLLGAAGATDLGDVPITTLFRTDFVFDADPDDATLALACTLDDGAVVYLNGVEVLRHNLPAGPIDAETRAELDVADGEEVYAELPTDALLRGTNVLAVELHQASDPDLVFGCALTARIVSSVPSPAVTLNELAPAGDTPFWVELRAAFDTDLAGLVLRSSGGSERVLSAGPLDADALAEVSDVGFSVAPGDVVFLYDTDGLTLLDAARANGAGRARAEAGGPWRVPTAPTPGAPNTLALEDAVVIHEIQYHAPARSRAGEPVEDDPEEWIELYNRGATPVSLDGWRLVDAVGFAFPSGTTLAPGGHLVVAADAAAFAAAHPGVDVIGDFEGRLDNATDRVLLLDARGNPADEVRYFDGGAWPEAADGGGSTLELRDPRADNAAAEAWAASDEAHRASWQTVRYRGVAASRGYEPDGAWNELAMGLLDGGEVLLDDVRVVADPDGAAIPLVQNSGFDAGSDAWRLRGNHRHAEVVADPDDPSNPVLRLVATGPTGHMHNLAETTLTREIRNGVTYEISLRARWRSGNNQLHTRLYFNRVAQMTRIDRPEGGGTPGAANSRREDLGPTFADLAQDVAVPAPYAPVAIGVSVADPDGVRDVTLWTSVDGGAFTATAMAEGSPGRWEASVEGRAAGTVVQFYVEAEDGAGLRATYPAAGPDARALLTFSDPPDAADGLHAFRIVMTAADAAWLHDDVNLMSDDLIGATVVVDEQTVHHDVGVRLKGSQRGRPEDARVGWAVRFRPDRPFRGSHTSVLVDRSEGVGYGQREVLTNLVMARAGVVSAEYNDVAWAVAPLDRHSGPVELQLDRFTDLVLAAQFDDGDDGERYEFEYVYYPLTTDDGTAEGQKLPQPDAVVGAAVTDLGDDPEAWRWVFLLQNGVLADDFTPVQELGACFAAPDFPAGADAVIDVDQWLRAFAVATLAGAVDNYGGDGSGHNASFYARPADGRLLYFPHDLDYFGSADAPLVNNGDLARLLTDPANLRAYHGHLADLVATAYNADYLGPWCERLAALTGQNFASHCAFVAARADWVMYGAPDAVTTRFPPMPFAITTEGGADFAVTEPSVTLEGDGWIDVRAIRRDGAPLAVTWVDEDTWRVEVPLAPGPNDITLEAIDLHGAVVGEDTVRVTSG